MWHNRSKLSLLTVCALCAGFTVACRGGSRGRSDAAKWVDSPQQAQRQGNTYSFPELGVKFEVPDTLYVYKSCGEASHSPEGTDKWIPVLTCQSGGGDDVFSDDMDSDEDEDPFAGDAFGGDDDDEGGDEAEAINLTFYVTHKTRPLDERAVSWFENRYKEAGLEVDEVSFQHNYQKKAGIYAKLQVTDGGNPSREIVQFMFPRQDVVFIARMEYPFGETRSVDADWGYILWNFDFASGGGEKSKGDDKK